MPKKLTTKTAFIAGTISLGGKPHETAAATSPKAALTNAGGSFVAMVHKPGSYTIQVHANGAKPFAKSVKVTKLDGKIYEVLINLKPAKPAKT